MRVYLHEGRRIYVTINSTRAEGLPLRSLKDILHTSYYAKKRHAQGQEQG